MNFNEKLTELRKRNGLSQEELGNKLNVARQTVSKWENGETTPEMNKLIEISKIFNITLDELIKDKINNQKHNSSKEIIYVSIFILAIVFGAILYKLNIKQYSPLLETQKQLTFGKVEELSKKGSKLSWVDFEDYKSEDIGSGLKVLYYEIEGEYHLLIGGRNEYEKPDYIRLSLDSNHNKYIDIRNEDINDFIMQTHNNETIDAND